MTVHEEPARDPACGTASSVSSGQLLLQPYFQPGLAGPCVCVESLNSLPTCSLLPETLRTNFFILSNKDKSPNTLSAFSHVPLSRLPLLEATFPERDSQLQTPNQATRAQTHLADMPLARLQHARSILLL